MTIRRRRELHAPDFVGMAHHNVFGSSPGLLARRRYTALLADHGRAGLVSRMLTEPAHADRIAAETQADAGLSDEAFVDWAYRTLLEREPDPDGTATALKMLSGSSARPDVLRWIAGSDEYRQRALPRYFPLADLRALRPERYGEAAVSGPEQALLFRAEDPGDFDWIESAILEGGYYDKPGIWGFGIDTDKRLMAEVVASLEPKQVLELGCASGPVLQCLHEMGIEVEGLEISELAIAAAFPEVRDRIHRMNACDFALPSTFDAIFGLDIFEHLNPNRLADCLTRIEAHLKPGGFVFANIPAFGLDPVFGQVFPVYVDEWEADVDRGINFHSLHCDPLGYPLNGHLIWARTDWWVRQFEAVGLSRQAGIEAALHARYDAYLATAAPARRSFYVFSKNAEPAEVTRIEAAIRASGSSVLQSL